MSTVAKLQPLPTSSLPFLLFPAGGDSVIHPLCLHLHLLGDSCLSALSDDLAVSESWLLVYLFFPRCLSDRLSHLLPHRVSHRWTQAAPFPIESVSELPSRRGMSVPAPRKDPGSRRSCWEDGTHPRVLCSTCSAPPLFLSLLPDYHLHSALSHALNKQVARL